MRVYPDILRLNTIEQRSRRIHKHTYSGKTKAHTQIYSFIVHSYFILGR